MLSSTTMAISVEYYLKSSEKYLSDLSSSDRAQVILELKRRLELFLQEGPGKKFPHQRELVNEIRAEMDLPQSPYSRAAYSVKRLWKFAAVFLIFIGLISTMMMVTFAMIWKYFPLIDAKEDRLVMLGGLIDIDKRLGRAKIMDNYQYLDNQFTNSFEGSIDILNNEFEELVVNFKSGTLDIENGETQKISWKCQMDSPPKAEYVNKSSAIIELDFEKLDGIACTLRVAPELKVTIDGHDGRLQIKEPLFDIYAEIKFGQIIFTPNPEIDYQYLVEVGQGQKSEFISSNKDGAVEINLNLGSGQVMRTDL